MAGFRDLMASARREGWSAWSDATELKVTVVPLLETPGSEVEVVVLDGVVAQEGPPARAVAALAVRLDAGAGFVEPAVPGRALGLVDLLPGATVAVGTTIPVHVDDAVASVVIIDGSGVPAADVRALAGQHTLTVGMVTAQGTIALDTVSFTAA